MLTIDLTKGYVARIDDEDADLAQHRWYASVNSQTGHVYAKRSTPEGGVYLHRIIAERAHGAIPPGRVVDHERGDTLDCRRAELRVVPHRVNLWNQHGAGRDSRSGVRGVRNRRGRWAAYICEGRKMYHLGVFDTLEEARAARLAAEAKRLEAHAA